MKHNIENIYNTFVTNGDDVLRIDSNNFDGVYFKCDFVLDFNENTLVLRAHNSKDEIAYYSIPEEWIKNKQIITLEGTHALFPIELKA